MRERGTKVAGIARELGISRPTVRKYMKARKPPEYNKKRRVSILDTYKPFIKDRVDRYNLSAVRILAETRKREVHRWLLHTKELFPHPQEGTHHKNCNTV